MLPTVASFLTYLKGLSPRGRKALAFGSYGWSGQSIGQVADMLEESKFGVLGQIKIRYRPVKEDLKAKINEIKGEIKKK